MDPNVSGGDTSQSDYEALRQHLLEGLRSSYEQYDRAVLTLSTGLLGISVAFIQPHQIQSSRQAPCLLAFSWLCLLFAIATTVLSLLASQRAIRKALDDAHDIYILGKHEVAKE